MYINNVKLTQVACEDHFSNMGHSSIYLQLMPLSFNIHIARLRVELNKHQLVLWLCRVISKNELLKSREVLSGSTPGKVTSKSHRGLSHNCS